VLTAVPAGIKSPTGGKWLQGCAQCLLLLLLLLLLKHPL
jgi:hypothetical protein